MKVITDADIYMQIAEEALREMTQRLEEGRRPKPNGEPGYILTPDPERRSFKQALIAQVFASMCFEAECYIYALSKISKSKASKIDRLNYECRLRELGFDETHLLNKAQRLRKARKDIVHEKPYVVGEKNSGEIRIAQKEAEFAVDFVREVRGLLLSDKSAGNPQ